MFENILTKDSVSFKDLEEIAFKIACEFENEILKNMLEEYDKQVMDSRDTRTKYITKNEKGKNKCIYLIDEMLNIKEKVEVFQKDKLKTGEKETPTIYQEADGIMIYTQGKDRKEQMLCKN